MYKSIATGTYEVILRATKREIGDLSNTFRLVFDDFGGDKIKGCSEIVDNIPDDRGNDLGKALWPTYRDMVAFVTGSAILVDASGINVFPDKGSEPYFKLVDVLVGPFDL